MLRRQRHGWRWKDERFSMVYIRATGLLIMFELISFVDYLYREYPMASHLASEYHHS